VTRQLLSEYVVLVRYDGKLVTGFDWFKPRAVPGGAIPNEMWPEWFSFYGPFALEFPAAEQRLREHFGDRAVRIRFVGVPRGWWVVGRAADDERAVFIAHQGSYDDDPLPDRLYDVREVLAYGAPHFGRP